MAKWKADGEKWKAEWKPDRKEVVARLEAIHDNQMSSEPKMEHQEKMDAWIADMKDGQKETTGCQEATEANPGRKEAVVERQEIPNEEVAVHFLRAC
jgi:hypothetical protein